MDIISHKEAKSKGLKFYFTNTPCKRGHVCKRFVTGRYCFECKSEYVEENKEWQSNYKKEYGLKNKDKIQASGKNYRLKNVEKLKIKRKIYKQNNKGVLKAWKAKKRNISLLAQPKWANIKEIKEIYKNCPQGYHVDHIIPLLGKLVCGLHVETNLQYLTMEENLSKGNKYEIEISRRD